MTPSTLELLTSGLPFGAGGVALEGVTETDGLRAGIAESAVGQDNSPRTWWLPIDRRLAARPTLCSLDLVLPLFHDLFGEVGYLLGIMGSEFADCETSPAFLDTAISACKTEHESEIPTLRIASLT